MTEERGAPTGPGEPASPTVPRARFSLAIYAGLVLAAVPITLGTLGLSAPALLANLPTALVDLSYSFTRMLLAYLASLGFALAYGYYAASHRTGERVMIPVLDILQSVPILGFFPIAIAFFVALDPNSFIGPNIASIFLIFTSMAWNMVFGVYESIKTMPSDLKEAAESFNSRGLQRLRRVVVPATINRLVYNSVLSWTAGWFFLVEAEIFTTNSKALPGIGSFLALSAEAGHGSAFFAGLLALIALIVVLDFFVWRPASRWAERFRYDTASAGESIAIGATEGPRRFRRTVEAVGRGVRSGVTRVGSPFVQLAAYTSARIPRRAREPRPWTRSAVYYVALGSLLVIVWLILIAIGVAAVEVYRAPLNLNPVVPGQMLQIPLAALESTARIFGAYAACLAIGLPLALYFARRPRASRVGLPIVEIIASFPATALFPVVIFVLIPYISAEGAAILMLMSGMMWYLFFNMLSGVRSVPPDLEEAARSFGLSDRKMITRVLLPAAFPAFITGSITAFGGGWNTLIVAEYLSVGHHSFQLVGLGASLDLGSTEPYGTPLMLTALLVLVAVVIAFNELLWKPLYRRAVDRYRFD